MSEEQPPIEFTLSALAGDPQRGEAPRVIATAKGYPAQGQAGTVEDAVRAMLTVMRRARAHGDLTPGRGQPPKASG